MKIIGVTGPTGAGKSFLCQALAKHFAVIDADEVYHSLLLPPSDCLTALRAAFGDGIFTVEGSLDRNALAEIVFSDEEKLTLLNRTVLDFVLVKIRTMIASLAKEGHSCVLIDAPTLIESGFHSECDAVIAVLASPELRLSRIIERDTISEEKAQARLSAQKEDEFYRLHADLVLINDGNMDSLTKQAMALLHTQQ